MFDFSTIFERTERRVRDDLLGAGPKTVEELRSIEGRLRIKYKKQLERRIQRANERHEGDATTGSDLTVDTNRSLPVAAAASPSPQFKEAMGMASNFAGGLFARVKGRLNQNEFTQSSSATIVDLPPVSPTPVPASATAAPPAAAAVSPTSGNSAAFSDWTGTDIDPATEGITNFSIGDDDDDDADLLGL